MRIEIDSKIEQLIRTKTYIQLTKSELELVNSNCSQEEYENYYLFFQEVENSFQDSSACLKIPKEVQESIFNSFKTDTKTKKIMSFNNSLLKPIMGMIAAALIFIVIMINLPEKEVTLELTNNDFHSFTQLENFGLFEDELDQVSITLKNMEIPTTIIEGSVPNCEW